MNWFKRFICSHEVDLEFMDSPVCVKCGADIPRVLTTNYGWKVNPIIEKWMLKRTFRKINEKLKAQGDKK